MATAPIPEQGYLTGILGIMLKTEIELSDGSEATKAELVHRFKQIKTRGQADAYIKEVMAKVEAERLQRAG